MKLLQIADDNYTLEIEPEIFTIGEFAELVESRKKNPGLLHKELGYIYFFTDMGSDFQFQTSEIERHKDIIKYLDLPTGWKKDRVLEKAIEAYKYLSQTPTSRLLESAYISTEKIKKQLESIDLNERDKSGKPVWNVKQILDTVKAMPSLMDAIQEAEKKYIKLQETSTKLRANKNKSVYDDIDMSKK